MYVVDKDKECVLVKNVIFSMARMCHGKKRQIQHGWNVSWSKMSDSVCPERAVVKKPVRFSVDGMGHGRKRQIQHGWNLS
jgi:hypothetical protein